MLPYPPPYAQSKTEENQILRPLGAILALLGALLAVLGIIFHQGGVELVFALLITVFSLRIFVLWLGDAQRNQKLKPLAAPPSALYNSQTLTQPFPPQPGYFVPQQPQPPFFQHGTNQMTVPFAPAQPGVPFVPASSQGLPPSVRPPAQTGFFSPQAQAMPPGSFAPVESWQWGQGQQPQQEEGW